MKYSLFILMSLVITMVVFLSACGKKAALEDSLSVDPVEASVETGITMVSGMADEQAGSALAIRTESSGKPSIWKILVGSNSYASACVRAYYSACIAGVKSVNYSQCDVAGTSRSLYGNVALTYSDSTCGLAVNGDTVTRTYSLEIDGPRGGVITQSSQNKADYRGTVIGGGGQLTKVASGWQLDILGRNTALSFRSHPIFDVSVRTLTPLSVTGGLTRASRVVTGGQVEVNHNLAGFTAVFAPTNLQWSNSCCHPISGSLAVTYSGSKTGSATVTFNGCGSASVNQGGQVSSIQLSYCE